MSLEDLERKGSERYGLCSYCIEGARQEAIKIAKQNIKDFKAVGGYELYAIDLSDWLEFFNLTMGDLK